jgi:phosphoglycerol transferase MdoB-like AlkP superfamily enzyme
MAFYNKEKMVPAKILAIILYWRKLPNYKYSLLFTIAVGILYAIWMNLPVSPVSFLPGKSQAHWLWLAMFLCTLVLFGRHYLVGIFWWSVIVGALFWANDQKIKLLSFPVIKQDIDAFLTHPQEIFSAAGIDPDTYAIIAGFLAILVCAMAARVVMQTAFFIKSHSMQTVFLRSTIYIACVTCTMMTTAIFYSDYARTLYTVYNKNFTFPLIRSQSEMARTAISATPLAFIAYSHEAATHNPMYSDDPDLSTLPNIDAANLQKNIAPYTLKMAGSKLNPNIVFLLAESTFDPNKLFRLNKHFDNKLFKAVGNSVVGNLYVSTAGGGTWKTEFETITGMISAMFGMIGEYTHYTLSRNLVNSFVMYLSQKDYSSYAFIPTSGDFFGSRNAYDLYGFDQLYDNVQIGISSKWMTVSDQEMVDKSLDLAQRNHPISDKPFFWYFVLLENHSPHSCKNYTTIQEMNVTFEGEDTFVINCMLNIYLNRTLSTEKAYQQVLKTLKNIEAKTKRPYILLTFGDHQPTTFIHDGFNKYRTDQSKYKTFFKIEASPSIKLPKIDGTMHAAFLPSLISTVFAKKPDEIYLPMNLFVHNICKENKEITDCEGLNLLKPLYRTLYK